MRNRPKILLPLAVIAVLLSTGCAKKAAKVQPPIAPPAQAPSATLAANPNSVQQGQPITLTWQTSNATEITVAGLGTVPPTGSRTLTPNTSTTYTLTANGPGGTRDASARVTVNPKLANATPSPSDEESFSKNVKDVLFDFNDSKVRQDEVATTQNDAAFLVHHPNVKIVIEGHCDDRGSVEYNLALGTSRAESVKQSLLQQGISDRRLRTISYGKERPFCSEDNEQCWQQNRVGHFVFEH